MPCDGRSVCRKETENRHGVLSSSCSLFIARSPVTVAADQIPEATAQATCADRLMLTEADLAKPSPQLLDRLAALNPAARIDDAAAVAPTSLMFSALPSTDARSRLVATAIHAHGIRSVVLVLRRPMSRSDFYVGVGRTGHTSAARTCA